jgi:integrase
MARRPRGGNLENRTLRLKLEPRRTPHMVRLAPGIRLGYRRNRSGGGSWSVLRADGQGSSWMKAIGLADDHQDADGKSILSFWQAQKIALDLARGERGDDSGRPVTVNEALDAYALHLRARGGENGNVSRVRYHLSAALAATPVSLLTTRQLSDWRNSLLAKGVAAATIARTCKNLKAALTLAADHDEVRISNRNTWRKGLASLPNATTGARNVVLPDDKIRSIVAAAYQHSHAFGLLIEVMAQTGARASQIRRLTGSDLQHNRLVLMMPSSHKGRGQKKITHTPVPIFESLASALRDAARGREADAPLLIKPDGEPWGKQDFARPFADVVRAVGLDPTEVTGYALRHSSITRQLLRGVPIRIVASLHDTSVGMIEMSYSALISHHADDLVRGALLDTGTASAPPADKVVKLRRDPQK